MPLIIFPLIWAACTYSPSAGRPPFAAHLRGEGSPGENFFHSGVIICLAHTSNKYLTNASPLLGGDGYTIRRIYSQAVDFSSYWINPAHATINGTSTAGVW